jgi:hypothetical protein
MRRDAVMPLLALRTSSDFLLRLSPILREYHPFLFGLFPASQSLRINMGCPSAGYQVQNSTAITVNSSSFAASLALATRD